MVCQISLGGAANQSCRNVHMMCLFGRMMCTARKLGWRLRHSIVRMRAAKSCAVEVSPQQSAVLKTLRILKLRLIGAAASASATADVRYINCIWVEVAAESRPRRRRRDLASRLLRAATFVRAGLAFGEVKFVPFTTSNDKCQVNLHDIITATTRDMAT